MANFPTFNDSEDASKYGFEVEDVGMRSDMEGGYVISRPRHTRTPRRTWQTGFTDLSNDEYLEFLDFWNDHGTYKAFTYAVKTSTEEVNVRFAQKPEFKYAGVGANYRWNIEGIKLEEV